MRRAAPLLAVVGVGLLVACAPARQAAPTASTAPAAASAATTPTGAQAPKGSGGATTAQQVGDTGKVVYQQRCAVCHGDQGQGLVGPAA